MFNELHQRISNRRDHRREYYGMYHGWLDLPDGSRCEGFCSSEAVSIWACPQYGCDLYCRGVSYGPSARVDCPEHHAKLMRVDKHLHSGKSLKSKRAWV